MESDLTSDQGDNNDDGHKNAQSVIAETSNKRTKIETEDSPAKKTRHSSSEIIIKIVSAIYGPCEDLRLPTGEISNDESSSIPITRDVAPFLRALLIAGRLQEERSQEHNNPSQSYIYLMGEDKDMNAAFGDPCPGTSKRLHVHYVVTEASSEDSAKSRAAKTEVHKRSFAEHERVVLRRRLTFYQDDLQLKQAVERSVKQQQMQSQKHNNQHTISASIPEHKTLVVMKSSVVNGGDDMEDDDDDEATLQQARKMGRSQSIAEFTEETMSLDALRITQSTTPSTNENADPSQSQPSTITTTNPTSPPQHHPTESSNSITTTTSHLVKPWRLRSAVSEIVLPIVLPFLEVPERVKCRLVCRSWKHVVRDWGVATTIDSNDPNISNFTRPFLRGILAHSYSSLSQLLLSGFEKLTKDDLHPAIPHFLKLRSLDVTRCHNLDDSTLQLLSQHMHRTLQVLYIKGLRRVTDVGMKAICQSCSNLEVLEISFVPITDESGMAIQQLTKLRALFMRDNYQLTNRSIDKILEKCTRLAELTLWGCIRLKHLSFAHGGSVFRSSKLVTLNLWGCHSLTDDAAQSLECMTNLKSLIVSECHRLTDQFVVSGESKREHRTLLAPQCMIFSVGRCKTHHLRNFVSAGRPGKMCTSLESFAFALLQTSH
jgi:hypothetical protein